MVELITDRRRRRKASDGIERWTFNHGLGDALMLRSVLEHCTRPIRLRIPVECQYSEIFDDLPHVEVRSGPEPGHRYTHMRFYPEDSEFEPKTGKKTKTRICLEKELNVWAPFKEIKPRPLDLSHVENTATMATEMYLRLLVGQPYIVFHGQGASSPERKDCPLWLAYYIATGFKDLGLKVVVINYDFNYRFKGPSDYWFIDDENFVSTNGFPLGAAAMWRVLQGAHAFVGIDSGPLHMALTIPGLRCAFIKNRIDFMTCFYDGGLDAIERVLGQESSFREIDTTIERLAG